MVERGLVEVDRLEAARLVALSRRLSRDACHALHFVGHGEFDHETQSGELIFEDERGRGRHVPADRIATILSGHRSLRLVVLNSCEGARASRTDPFAGTAQALVRQGIPAVIAMQFEITDEAAITLAEAFYGSVAVGRPVDASLADARRAIYAEGNGVEWATPVLYFRAPDGRVFDVERTPGVEERLAMSERPGSVALDSAEPEARLAADRAAVPTSVEEDGRRLEAEAAARERAERERLEEERRQQANQAVAREMAKREAAARAEEARRRAAQDAARKSAEEQRRRAKQEAERPEGQRSKSTAAASKALDRGSPSSGSISPLRVLGMIVAGGLVLIGILTGRW